MPHYLVFYAYPKAWMTSNAADHNASAFDVYCVEAARLPPRASLQARICSVLETRLDCPYLHASSIDITGISKVTPSVWDEYNKPAEEPSAEPDPPLSAADCRLL